MYKKTYTLTHSINVTTHDNMGAEQLRFHLVPEKT